MSRRPEEEGARIARLVLTDNIAKLLGAHYGPDKVVAQETNTGLCQVRIHIAPNVAYHLTVTKARR